MCVYLIHFDQPFKHAAHYVGYARELDKRLAHHAAGTGANLLRVVGAAGIAWKVVRVWEGQDRAFERRLKNCKHTARYCPVCAEEKVRGYKPRNATQIAL